MTPRALAGWRVGGLAGFKPNDVSPGCWVRLGVHRIQLPLTWCWTNHPPQPP